MVTIGHLFIPWHSDFCHYSSTYLHLERVQDRFNCIKAVDEWWYTCMISKPNNQTASMWYHRCTEPCGNIFLIANGVNEKKEVVIVLFSLEGVSSFNVLRSELTWRPMICCWNWTLTQRAHTNVYNTHLHMAVFPIASSVVLIVFLEFMPTNSFQSQVQNRQD